MGIFLLMIFFSFFFFFTQYKKLNHKLSVIKQAMNDKKEVYLDPIDWKMHYSGNGAIVMYTYLPYNWEYGKQNSLPGDKVLLGCKDNIVYINYSKRDFIKHIQEQKNNGRVWCGERKEYRDHGCWKDNLLKYHMTDKYFYKLSHYIIRSTEYNQKGGKDATIYCYKMIYDPRTRQNGSEIEIGYNEYIKLGGEKEVSDCVHRHIK